MFQCRKVHQLVNYRQSGPGTWPIGDTFSTTTTCLESSPIRAAALLTRYNATDTMLSVSGTTLELRFVGAVIRENHADEVELLF